MANIVVLWSREADIVNEKERLVTLLDYLVGHNREHSEELKELAGEVKGPETDTVRSQVLEAAQLMGKATESLEKALSALKGD